MTMITMPQRGVGRRGVAATSAFGPRPVGAWLLALFLFAIPAAAQDHVVVLLDASGSMDGRFEGPRTKMDVAKEALVGVLSDLPAETRVGLAVFGGSKGRRGGGERFVYDLQRIDGEALRRELAQVEPRGGTPLGEFLKVGADRLLEARRAAGGAGSYRLLVVTDGEADDRRLVEAYLPDIRSRGVAVDVIGVQMSGDLPLAREVDSYRTVDDPASLVRGLREVLSEVPTVRRTGGDTAGTLTPEEAFATIAPLPDGAAQQMLAALERGADRPIGEVPTVEGAVPMEAGDDPMRTRGPIVNGREMKPGTDTWASVVVGTCGGGLLITLLFVIIIMVTFNRMMK